MMKIGVLALQGAFSEHIRILTQLGVQTTEVRLPGELDGLDGLIIPGGESTAIIRLVDKYGLREPICHLGLAGVPIMGTCAGLILLAKSAARDDLKTFGLMDITVHRNAFGRQVDSFEVSLNMPCLGAELYRAIFIRAPIIETIGTSCNVLASLHSGEIVAVRQGNLLALAFHPELDSDTRLHSYFLKMTEGI